MLLVQYAVMGALGGLGRGLMGAYKNSLKIGTAKKISWGKLGLNIVCATIIGSIVGMIVDTSPVTALCAGYAGIDIVENLIKLS